MRWCCCSARRSSMRSWRSRWASACSGAISASPGACSPTRLAVAGHQGCRAVALSRRRRRRLHERGRAADDWRKIFHHLTFYGFLLCFAATALATLYHYLLGREAPYPWYDLPVVLGTLGGIGLVIGPAGLLARNSSAIRRWSTRRNGMDVAFIAMLLLTGLTGLALLVFARYGWMGPLLALHLGIVFCAVHHHALWQVRARHLPLPRAGALCPGATDDGPRTIVLSTSLRAKRSNPFFLCLVKWIASLRSQ